MFEIGSPIFYSEIVGAHVSYSHTYHTFWFLQDILEFIDYGCNGFLSNICLVIASYNDMFLNREQSE